MIENGDEWVSKILNEISWDKNSISQENILVQCPINYHHSVSPDFIENHKQKCSHRSKGYTDSDMSEEKSSTFFYGTANDVIQLYISKDIQSHILKIPKDDFPLTTKRSLVELNSKQRLKIYEHCTSVVSSKKSCKTTEEFCIFSDIEKSIQKSSFSKLEMLALEREMKRRPQSYKNKNVYHSNRNYTEVVREILNNQMKFLAANWNGKSVKE